MVKIRSFVQENWAILLITIFYSGWGLAFIYHSSYVASDGKLYFALFDDAMISMRYAWNFAHGNGLVWNTGEYVEGYTNLLMTLLMAVASFFFEKRYAVLAIQLTGIPFMLGIAFFSWKIFQTFKNFRSLSGLVLIASILLYYPLNYWSLMGMETGLLTVLLVAGVFCSILYVETLEKKYLNWMTLSLGLAYLTRNDSLLFAGLVFLYLTQTLKTGTSHIKDFFASGLTLSLFPIGQTLFRYFYYGSILPNTYTLKLVGMALDERLRNGWGFVQPFWKETGFILVFAVLALLIKPSIKKLYLFGFFVIAISYQIYVGGDPWTYWRMMAPAMPFVLLLFVDTCNEVLRYIPNKFAHIVLLLITVSYGLYKADSRFLKEMSMQNLPYDVESAHDHIEVALALNELTNKDASIAVLWAGTLPYYSDRYAIDMLGKSDVYIANLPPDTSGIISWDGMDSVPGHNKYDLHYSIQTLLPTYTDTLQWGMQDLTEWGNEHYVRIRYHKQWILLLKDSPNVNWEKIETQ